MDEAKARKTSRYARAIQERAQPAERPEATGSRAWVTPRRTARPLGRTHSCTKKAASSGHRSSRRISRSIGEPGGSCRREQSHRERGRVDGDGVGVVAPALRGEHNRFRLVRTEVTGTGNVPAQGSRNITPSSRGCWGGRTRVEARCLVVRPWAPTRSRGRARGHSQLRGPARELWARRWEGHPQ